MKIDGERIYHGSTSWGVPIERNRMFGETWKLIRVVTRTENIGRVQFAQTASQPVLPQDD